MIDPSAVTTTYPARSGIRILAVGPLCLLVVAALCLAGARPMSAQDDNSGGSDGAPSGAGELGAMNDDGAGDDAGAPPRRSADNNDDAGDSAEPRNQPRAITRPTTVYPPVESRYASRVLFFGDLWTGWAGDVSEGYGFPNQFFVNRVSITLQGNITNDGEFGFRARLTSTGIGTGSAQEAGNTSTINGAIPTIGGGYVFFEQAFVQIYGVLLDDSSIRLGATYLPFLEFSEGMFASTNWTDTEPASFRILRESGPELWGYQTKSDIGLTHTLLFNDGLIRLQYGVWNGGYLASGTDSFGGEHLQDWFKVAGIGLTVEDPQGGFAAQFAFLLQSETGDDPREILTNSNGDADGVVLDGSETGGVRIHRYEDGYRLQAGLYFLGERSFRVGFEFGAVIDAGFHDALAGWASSYAILNLALLNPNLEAIEVIARVDVHQLNFNDPTRGEDGDTKYFRSDGSLRFFLIDPQNQSAAFNDQFLGGWELGLTFGVAFRLDPMVTLHAPVFKGDYSDARRDASIVAAYLAVRF